MNILLMSSEAESIKQQARFIAGVLVSIGHQAAVFSVATRTLADRWLMINQPSIVINVIDPFIFNYYREPIPILGVRRVISYITADGVPAAEDQRRWIRELCSRTYVVANSGFSKANLEAVNCHVNEVIPNGVDWAMLSMVVKHRLINGAKYDMGSVGFYNPGLNEQGSNWMMDRKGYPALVGMLIRLHKMGYRYRAWIHSSPDLLGVFNRHAYRVVNQPHLGTLVSITPVTTGHWFFAVGTEPDDAHPVKLTWFGQARPIDVYANSYAYVSNSYVEGFGLTPIEALATGSMVIVNELPTFRENLGNAPGGCVWLIPIHATKQYRWGLRTNGLLMTFHIPDFNMWLDTLVRVINREVKYEPVVCSEYARRFDYRLTYSRFVKLVEGF